MNWFAAIADENSTLSPIRVVFFWSSVVLVGGHMIAFGAAYLAAAGMSDFDYAKVKPALEDGRDIFLVVAGAALGKTFAAAPANYAKAKQGEGDEEVVT